MVGRYDYKELRKKALDNGSQEDINALGEWFALYGNRYWNGECYDADNGIRVFPIYEEIDENQSDIIGYEIR